MATSKRKLIDLTGQTFGKLTVLREDEPSYIIKRPTNKLQRTRYWVCQCVCGQQSSVRQSYLRNGHTTSCGCSFREALGHRRTHGHAGDVTYNIWQGMLNRCRNPKVRIYKNYGGRGINVCERWRSFENFLEDMGERPSPNHSIDRRNNDGDYSPENCYWATRVEQNNNKRNNHVLTKDGHSLTLAQWSRLLQRHPTTLQRRLKRGLSIDEVLQ